MHIYIYIYIYLRKHSHTSESVFWSSSQKDFCCPTCQRCGYTMFDVTGSDAVSAHEAAVLAGGVWPTDVGPSMATREGSAEMRNPTSSLAKQQRALEELEQHASHVTAHVHALEKLLQTHKHEEAKAHAAVRCARLGIHGATKDATCSTIDGNASQYLAANGVTNRAGVGLDIRDAKEDLEEEHEEVSIQDQWKEEIEALFPSIVPLLPDEGERRKVVAAAFSNGYSAGFASCDLAYRWWREQPQARRTSQMCLERLVSLTPRWRCIGSGCSTCTGACDHVLQWEEYPKRNRTQYAQPDQNDNYHTEAALEASWSLNPTLKKVTSVEGMTMVVVTSAPGDKFKLRRLHSEALLRKMGIAGVLATSVTVDMVQPGGWLEMCVAQPHRHLPRGKDGGSLSESFFANGLNHLHTFLHAVLQGFEHLIVLEDDMVLDGFHGRQSLAPVVLLQAVSDGEQVNHDLIFFGSCANIRANTSFGDTLVRTYDHRESWRLWNVSRGSRCASAYGISRAGMLKMLLHLPMWCTIDWMMNGAKKAPLHKAGGSLQTTVLFLEPALFYEGSKVLGMPTTMTSCAYCGD